MLDKIELRVSGIKIENFLRYRVEGDLYTADHAFSFDVANPEIQLTTGMPVELRINGNKELTGIIDRRNPRYEKVELGRQLTLEGRDLMGLLVDSYCEQFLTLKGTTLKTLAQTLFQNIDKRFRNIMTVVYQENVAGVLLTHQRKVSSVNGLALSDTPQAYSQIEPGMTIFEVLKEYAQSRGMMFFCDNDGTFTFGRPKASGQPLFNLTTTLSGNGNNVIEGELDENISHRYSRVTVAGQQQGTDSTTATAINTKAVVSDSTFPFYKPFVKQNNNDRYSPKLQARMLMEKMKADGFKLSYTVAGHSQNGHNWKINELVRIKDEALGVNGTYLIYGRTFMFDKDTGPTTEIRLGYPGIIA